MRGLNSFLLNVTGHAVAVLIAVGFSRVRSVNDFKESFEFHPPSNRSAFVAVLIGAAIGMFAAIGSQSSVPHNRMVESFDPSDRGYLNIILLLAPFTEEVVLRGYLYKAFRQNYSPILSTIYILIFTVVLHLGPFSTSFIAAVSLLCLNIATCVLREKTGSLWNCVIAHLTYNVACILG